ncbi:hypothetical protein DFH27DRAFT_268672 [Peziza echinospora]|nr:hypothetical protein DFH27DRAFT_268672 [Peziza echinospora]
MPSEMRTQSARHQRARHTSAASLAGPALPAYRCLLPRILDASLGCLVAWLLAPYACACRETRSRAVQTGRPRHFASRHASPALAPSRRLRLCGRIIRSPSPNPPPIRTSRACPSEHPPSKLRGSGYYSPHFRLVFARSSPHWNRTACPHRQDASAV